MRREADQLKVQSTQYRKSLETLKVSEHPQSATLYTDFYI